MNEVCEIRLDDNMRARNGGLSYIDRIVGRGLDRIRIRFELVVVIMLISLISLVSAHSYALTMTKRGREIV